MKKIILFLVFFFSISLVHAEDCLHDPIYEQDWNAVVTTGARVRDIPCMETSIVMTTLPVGEVIKIIAKTDGWYKIRRISGVEGWVGQWLVSETDKPFTVTPPSPSIPLEQSGPHDIVGHPYETAIRYLYDAGIVSGYSDGSFKPNALINRAEFTKIIMGSSFTNDVIAGNYCFPDVAKQWFSSYICSAYHEGFIQGYPDGYFRPQQNINFVEASSIIVRSMKYPMTSSGSTVWYYPFVEKLSQEHAIPPSIEHADHFIQRGEMAEMMYRLKLRITTKDSKQIEDFIVE